VGPDTDPSAAPPLSRAERRQRSEAAILGAARALFAEHGYERTTIRGVADRAGVDAALVMQYFGSKEGLFAASARWSTPVESLVGAGRDQLPYAAVHHVLDAYEDPEQRAAAETLLRNCLTHPEAERVMREQVMGEGQEQVAAIIGGPDAELRAALLNACTLGLMISRYLLDIPAVAAADPADLDRVLGPALRALVGPD
jgi:AcrR family transcriptional regulator